MGALTKQAAEALPVDVSFGSVIGARTATSVATVVTPPAGMTLVSQLVSGPMLQLYISGGTSGQTYRWTLLTDIVIGAQTTRVKDEFDVVVQDVA